MTDINTIGSSCQHALRQLDTYLDQHLPPGEQVNVAAHLSFCAACACEAKVRGKLRMRLREVVKQQPVPAYLATRVMAHVRDQDRRRPRFAWRHQLSAAGVALAVVVTAAIAYQLGNLRWTASSQASYIASISQRIAGIMSVGLREHVHCSVFRRYPKQLKSLAELETRMPKEYRPVIPIVTTYVPSDFKVAIAHECGYADRGVIHIGMKSDSKLLSIVLVRKKTGETFTDADVTSVLSASGAKVYTAGVQRFQIATVESRGYLIYLVSDLPKSQNAELMLAMGPRIQTYLDGLRS